MYVYVLGIFVAWIIFKALGIVWRYIQTCRMVASIPKLESNHWFWGYMHKIEEPSDIQKLYLAYVQKKKPRWFVAWNMFFYPCINPVDPDTMRAVLTATNVPKNHGIAGAYRMLLGWIGDGLLVSNGKKWERNRRLLTPAFHFDILKEYVSVFNGVVDNFVGKVRELSEHGESIDVFPPVSRATLDTMLRCTVSYEDDTVQNTQDHHPYVVVINRLGTLIFNRILNPLHYLDFIYKYTSDGREFMRLSSYVHNFSTEIIRKRKRELKENPTLAQKRHLDFLDTLLTATDSDGEGLSDLEIRDQVDTFMFEGHDTTASAISWILNALAKYPTMQQKVRHEVEAILNGRSDLDPEDLSKLQYTTCFIKESLRMYTPVPATTRKLAEPLLMNGVTLKSGVVVDLYYYMVHHNPRVWENPEEFNPERFFPDNIKNKDPFAFIPFSAGQRNCIGQHFAMNEIKVFVSKVVTKFDIAMDPYRPAIPNPDIVMRAKHGIFLHFVNR